MPNPTDRISDADLYAETETRAPVPSTYEGDPAALSASEGGSQNQLVSPELDSTPQASREQRDPGTKGQAPVIGSTPDPGQDGYNLPSSPLGGLSEILAARRASRAGIAGTQGTDESGVFLANGNQSQVRSPSSGRPGQPSTAPLTVARDEIPFGSETRLNAVGTPLGRYIAKIDQKIRRTWVLPVEMRAMGVQGNVEVSFSVDRRGRVTKRRITRKSGNPDLDQVALNAIPDRFPRIPRNVGLREVNLSYLFRTTDFLIVGSQ